MRTFLFGALTLLFSLQASGEVPHAKEFWGGIVAKKFQTPDGTPPAQLAPELIELLGSRDGELRDDFALTILETWIYKRMLRRPR